MREWDIERRRGKKTEKILEKKKEKKVISVNNPNDPEFDIVQSQSRKIRLKFCSNCGLKLKGTEDVCPECNFNTILGEPITDAKHAQELRNKWKLYHNKTLPAAPAERNYPKHSILTFTHRIVEPLAMQNEDIDIIDIAKSLSNQSRFMGHSVRFYSTAQHCFIGSLYLKSAEYDEKMQLAFLLHDASEAYLCDIPSPLKSTELFKEYRQVERTLEKFIFKHFGVEEYFNSEIIKEYDMRMLLTEKRDVMLTKESWRSDQDFKPFETKIKPWLPKHAFDSYLRLAEKLIKEVGK